MTTKKFIVIEYEDYSKELTIRQFERIHQMNAAVNGHLQMHQLGYLDMVTIRRLNAFEIAFTCKDAEQAFWAVAPIMFQYDFMIDGFGRGTAPRVYLVHDGSTSDDYEPVSVEDYLENPNRFQAGSLQIPLIECLPARGEGGLFAALKQKFLRG